MDSKIFYRRNLPHWHPPGASLFVTWRLKGSLPENIKRILDDRRIREPGKRFHITDQMLDEATTGPLWLKDVRIARLIVESLRRGSGELRLYELHAFVVMANHVHVLMTPKSNVERITRGIKRRTAAQANQILKRPGGHFWQIESFDHWIRNDAEFLRVKRYIEDNPVKVGLVKRAEDWPWSSAAKL